MINKQHLLILLLIISGFENLLSAQNEYVKTRYHAIVNQIEKLHYSPRAIDDTFSVMLYTKLLEDLDNKMYLLTNEDVDSLNFHQDKIDDYINNDDYSFLNQFSKVLSDKHLEKMNYLKQLSQQKFDWNNQDTISLFYSAKKKYFPKNHQKKLWQKTIMYACLNAYFQKYDSIPPKDKYIALDELKEMVINNELCELESKHYNITTISDAFLRAVANTFDPHTVYFSNLEKDLFNSSLSKNSLTFGIEFGLNEIGEIIVDEVLPGSPAWESNNINEGDILVAVRTPNELLIKADCQKVDDIFNTIYSESIKEAVFTFRKADQNEIEVKLTKHEVSSSENVINSYILNGDKKIAYIYLPSFYSSSSERGYVANGCANDMAKELVKLKKEGIEGLILDIRNNGGGSIYEAIDLIGMFVNYGALGIIDRKNESPETFKDINRGVLFDAPLLILQNQLSASASELLASTLQDYNRAIIVGSQSYGKSTMQTIVPIENKINSENNISGAIKLTIGKFFRIDGSTLQKVGVKPDIALPGIYDKYNIGESNYPSALENTSILKKIYAYPLPSLPVDSLVHLSKTRCESNTYFLDIKNDSINSSTKIPLNFNGFSEYYTTKFSKKEISNQLNSKLIYSVISLSEHQNYGTISNALTKQIEINKNKITEDAYINESFLILKDLIDLIK